MRVNLAYELFDEDGKSLKQVNLDPTNTEWVGGVFNIRYALLRATYAGAFAQKEGVTDDSFKAFHLHMKIKATNDDWVDMTKEETTLALKCVKALWSAAGVCGQVDWVLEGKDLSGKAAEDI